VEGGCRAIAEPCLLLFHNASSGDNHSHWLLQTLPQLGMCERLGIRPELLVVQPNIRPYQRDVLAALGYGPERLLLRSPSCPMRFETLFAGYVDGGLVPDPHIFDRQIAAFDAGLAGPERIYVSRGDARGIRRLLNEADLIAHLQERGFTIVVPSALSAAEEVTMFRHARLIVGPLGAGLYNALFTRPGATIVALSDPFYVMEWLAQVAALRGHALGWCFGLGLESHDEVYAGTHGNWIVDIERVGGILAGLL
jgi:capsular polysaccharide biosynthesis protein